MPFFQTPTSFIRCESTTLFVSVEFNKRYWSCAGLNVKERYEAFPLASFNAN